MLKLTTSGWFFVGIILKIFLGSLLASYPLTDLFIPFVDYFASHPLDNPYEKFLNAEPIEHFPYPSLMLYIIALPKILLGQIAPTNPFWSLFLYRIPLLAADIGIFFILKNWLDEKFHRRLLWFYWFSPVLIYISYIHGQLDAIPIAFLFLSLFYLFRNKLLPAALFLGCALSTKTNIILVYPFFLLFFLSKKLPFKTMVLFFALSTGVFFVINAPYILDAPFIKTVFFNQEQDKVFSAVISLGNFSIYPIPASLLILFVHGALLKHYNRDIFIMFLGFAFSIILFFIAPMQGWYFWLIPFLVYFYVKESGRAPLIYFATSIFYLFYFIVEKNSDYIIILQVLSKGEPVYGTFYHYLQALGFDAEKIVHFSTTLLQTTLSINCFWIYKKGLESYSRHKLTAAPFLIGIGGNSGAGKTTLSNALLSIFTSSKATVLQGDDIHKWQRGHDKWNDLTHLDPKANRLHEEVDFLRKLKFGKKIRRRHYNHDTGMFTQEKTIESNNLIIYEGLHPFYLSTQRTIYDLKIFIKTSPDLMSHWKIIRDRKERDYSKKKIMEHIKRREEDSKKYIDTQMNRADIIIEILPKQEIGDIGEETEKVMVDYSLTLPNDIYIEPLVESLEKIKNLKISHQYTDCDRQRLCLQGGCSRESLEDIAKRHTKELEDLGISCPLWPKNLFGVVVLLLTYYIFKKAEYDRE